MSKFLKLVFAQLFLFAGVAHAYCGNDSVTLCPVPDQDNDDYASNGSGRLAGVDCDDTNWQIYPGITTGVGCGAGQVHTCQASGSYTSCIALSAFTPKTGTGADYWFAPAGVTTAGCGAIGSPCDYLCWSNPALGCYHTPAPGDAGMMRGGNYTTTWNDSGTIRMFWQFVHSGTALNPIRLMSAPGEVAVIVGQGVSPTQLNPFWINLSNYWLIEGITIHGGYSNSGVYNAGGTDVEVRNMTIYDIDGFSNDNVSGIKFSSQANNFYAHHNLMYDNYDRANLPAQNNNNGVRGFDSNSFKINNNVAANTNVPGAGYGFTIKHGFPAATGNQMLNNVVNRAWWDCYQNQSPGIEIAYNRGYDCNLKGGGTGIGLYDLGGYAEFNDIYVHNNFILHASSLELNPTDVYAPIGAHVLTYSDNVIVDNRAVYGLDGVNGFMRICNYCSNALYTNIVTGGKLTFTGNCYYNTLGTVLLFDLFSDSGSGSFGQNYFGLAAWQAAGFDYDTGTFNENPLLDAYDMPTSTNCVGKGWRPAAVPVNWGIMTKRLTRGHR